jgi:hypothetical protein
MNMVEALRADYARFPEGQTYALYAENVLFVDPFNNFRGRERFRQMVSWMTQWFKHLRLELHQISQTGNHIETRWTLSWQAPLPWQPAVQVSGWSELELDEEGLIASHIDHWDCSRLDLLRQHFSP